MAENKSSAHGHTSIKSSTRQMWKPILLLALVVGLTIIAALTPMRNIFSGMDGWIKGLGSWGPAAFVLIYIFSTVACIPGTLLTLASGALFGPLWGTVYVSVGSTIGASLCFLIARYFARSAVEGWIAKHSSFSKMDRMTERHGGLFVAVARLVPAFPFNLLNYGFGLTRIPFWIYAIASWIFMLPGTAMYVFGAAAVKEGVQQKRVPWGIIIAGVAIMLLALSLAKFAKSYIGRDAEPQADNSPEDEGTGSKEGAQNA